MPSYFSYKPGDEVLCIETIRYHNNPIPPGTKGRIIEKDMMIQQPRLWINWYGHKAADIPDGNFGLIEQNWHKIKLHQSYVNWLDDLDDI